MNAAELVLYTNPMSRGRIVRWMLEEVGADYEAEVIEYGPAMKSPEYLAINPMGKVPAIRHGHQVVTECPAICAYLADAFPEAGLAPPLTERSAYYRWLFFAAGPLEAAVTNHSLGVELDKRNRMMAGYGSYQDVMDTLCSAVSAGPYLAGQHFTAADVYVGAHISWGLKFNKMDRRPELEAYWARISDRPAYRRATELDDALVPRESGSG